MGKQTNVLFENLKKFQSSAFPAENLVYKISILDLCNSQKQITDKKQMIQVIVENIAKQLQSHNITIDNWHYESKICELNDCLKPKIKQRLSKFIITENDRCFLKLPNFRKTFLFDRVATSYFYRELLYLFFKFEVLNFGKNVIFCLVTSLRISISLFLTIFEEFFAIDSTASAPTAKASGL